MRSIDQSDEIGVPAGGWSWARLSPGDLSRAYALVAATGADHSPKSWLQHAGQWMEAQEPERGLVGLEGGWRMLFALFAYEVESDLGLHSCLCIPEFWLVDLGSRRHVAQVTLRAIDQVAHACSCDSVRLHVAASGPAGIELSDAVEPAACGYAVSADGRAWLRRRPGAPRTVTTARPESAACPARGAPRR